MTTDLGLLSTQKGEIRNVSVSTLSSYGSKKKKKCWVIEHIVYLVRHGDFFFFWTASWKKENEKIRFMAFALSHLVAVSPHQTLSLSPPPPFF